MMSDSTTAGPSRASYVLAIGMQKGGVAKTTNACHVAVALERPAVVLMGPTDPAITHQHMERQRVLREEVECSPCQLKRCPIDHRCMTRLVPERAVRAAEELLA